MVNYVQYCKTCSRKAKLECQICFEPYCSAICQRIDWPSHKSNCYPMPPLVETDMTNFSSNELLKYDDKTKQAHVLQKSPPMPKTAAPIYKGNDNIPAALQRPVKPVNFERSFSNNISLEQKNIPTDCAPKPITIQITEQKSSVESMVESTVPLSVKPLPPVTITIPEISKADNDKKITTAPSNDIVKKAEKSLPYNHRSVPSPARYDPNSLQNQVIRKPNVQTLLSVLSVSSKQVPKTIPHKWQIPLEINHTTEFFSVVVTYLCVENDFCVWVIDSNYQAESLKNFEDLNTKTQFYVKCQSLSDIKLGELYIAKFEGFFYRAVVTENKNPINEFKVRLLDYGNDFYTKYNELYFPTSEMKLKNCYAFKIKLPIKNTNFIVDEEIEIKLTGIQENDYRIAVTKDNSKSNKGSEPDMVVEAIESITEDEILLKKKDINIPSPKTNKAELLKPERINSNEIGSVFRIAVHNSPDHAICLFSDKSTEKLIDHWVMKEVAALSNNEKQAADGDFVFAKVNGKWYRAIIIASYSEKYLILLLDYGRIDIVDDIILSNRQHFNKFPILILFIQINNILIDHKVFTDSYFYENATLTYVLENDICYIIDDNLKVAEVSIEFWDLSLEGLCENINYYRPKIPINSTVNICAVYGPTHILVGLPDKLHCYDKIIQDIGKYSQQLIKRPSDNQLILVQSSNGSYYRGICLIEQDGKFCTVNVDVGTIIDVDMRSLRQITSFLKLAPIYTMNISWENSENAENKSIYIIDYLKSFSKSNTPFRLITAPDGVLNLCDNDNKNLNELIENISITSIANLSNAKVNSDLEDDRIYMKSVEILPLPTGRFITLFCTDDSLLEKGYLTASENNLLEFTNCIELCVKINQFANTLPSGTYQPQIHEMVMVKYSEDNSWYRGVCLSVNEELKTARILFVEYGNIGVESFDNLRKLPKEFLFKILASRCVIKEKLNPVSINKLREYIQENEQLITANEVTAFENGYLISIADLLQKL